MQPDLDAVDWRILHELQADGRQSYNALSRRVNLSAPAVAERVRRLENAGIISGYHARVDTVAAGFPVAAFVEMRCSEGRCLLKTSQASDYPDVVEIHKLTGEHCAMLRVRATSMQHFEGLLEQLGRHGRMRTSMVLSTQYDGRPVTRPSDDLPSADPSKGWSHP